jgi:hypothetical protein
MSTFSALLILLMLGLAGLIPGMVHALDESTIAQLHTAKEIYVSTKRKSGEWGSAAPVWFWYTDEVIYSTASPNSYKAKRILDGRNTVRIAVGSRDGPTFTGTAEIFTDATIVARMGEAYNNKYWLAWLGFARPRVSRVESGKTVAIKVTPDVQE